MKNIEFLKGEFVVYKGVAYRSVSYQYDYELYELNDKNLERTLMRIKKEVAEDYYYSLARCSYNNIHYVAHSIIDNKCYFKKTANHKDNDLENISVSDMDEIWIQHNRNGHNIEKISVYQNKKYLDNPNLYKPSEQTFYAEEMANGDIMISFLDDEKDLNSTITDLKSLFGDRIEIGEPNMALLMTDYYISQIRIDDSYFCMDCDYGIITISPEDTSGNPYIWEIIDHFNKNS